MVSMLSTVGTGWERLVAALVETVDLVLPASCAVCADAGGPVCERCRRDVRASALTGAARCVTPVPAPPGMPACWASARFEDAVRSAVTAYKDDGRRDLRPVLAERLALALACALAEEPVLRRAIAAGERVLVVPLPTSRGARRRRGDDPVGDLTRAAVERVGGPASATLPVVAALEHVRSVADQSHLGRQARRDNLSGAMAVAAVARHVVRGSVCVLADDVVTTGATVLEAARALRCGGARHVVAVAVAATARRFPAT